MKRLPAALFCIMLATALVACGQDKGKATTEKKATTQAPSKATTEKKATTKAQSKATTEKKASTKAQKKAPTLAQKKEQERLGDCQRQASLKNMKGEDRKRFMSSCTGG